MSGKSSSPVPAGMSAGEIAELVGGEVVGDPSVMVTGVSGVEAGGEGHIVLAEGRFEEALSSSAASVAVVGTDAQVPDGMTAVRCERADLAFCRILESLVPPSDYPGGVAAGAHVSEDASLAPGVTVRPMAVVESGAVVGAGTVLHSGCFVGRGVTVGAGCVIWPGAALCDGVTLGDRVVIGPNTAIGYDGFGFIPGAEVHTKIPQVGTVIIEDDVEIGACCTVDRARFDATVVGAGTKIDNLCQVAHNVKTGRLCLFAAQAGVAGSTELGDGVMLGGQAAVAGHLKIGSGVIASGKAGVTKSIPDGKKVYGFPAVSKRDWIGSLRAAKKVEALSAEIERMKVRLDELTGETEDTGGSD